METGVQEPSGQWPRPSRPPPPGDALGGVGPAGLRAAPPALSVPRWRRDVRGRRLRQLRVEVRDVCGRRLVSGGHPGRAGPAPEGTLGEILSPLGRAARPGASPSSRELSLSLSLTAGGMLTRNCPRSLSTTRVSFPSDFSISRRVSLSDRFSLDTPLI